MEFSQIKFFLLLFYATEQFQVNVRFYNGKVIDNQFLIKECCINVRTM